MRFSERARGAELLVLDKIYGLSEKIEVFDRSNVNYGSINVFLNGCFYNKGNPTHNVLASVSITDGHKNQVTFSGWISSAQSHLTNYNNYRYIVWLLSCMSSDQVQVTGKLRKSQ